ncbi:MAG: D-alanine--D-alanine ligase [Bdellovibrionaceae bacterium]|nr:D-alanine--D-alanine ligase [Pseudobdellovibrionaceae bacterium]
MSKTKLVLFFGGRSAEHEVSVVSARNISRALSEDKFELSFVGIRDTGDWVLLKKAFIPDALKRVEELPAADVDPVSLGCEGGRPHLFFTRGSEKRPVDVAFPVLHGTYGEDGSIQGLFRVMRLPFVGCGVTSSAVGMDKDFLKRLLNEAKIPNAPFMLITPKNNPGFDALEKTLGLPFFIKPANAGSSVGVHKIKSRADFDKNLADAFQYDRKILAEKFMKGREIEISAFGPTEDCKVSLPGEVIPQHEFYSYEAKYLDPNGAAYKIPVEMTPEELATIQKIAKDTYRVLGCEGMARIDFFMTGPNQFHINEINTLPGFTSISMYPKMWEASGWGYKDLIHALIDDALTKARTEDALKTQFPRG